MDEDALEAVAEYMRTVGVLVDFLIEKDIRLPLEVSLPLKAASGHATEQFNRLLKEK